MYVELMIIFPEAMLHRIFSLRPNFCAITWVAAGSQADAVETVAPLASAKAVNLSLNSSARPDIMNTASVI